MKERHHVAEQMLKEQQYKKDNGPITVTVDQIWKYSGKIEEYDNNYKNLILESTMVKSARLPTLKSRREYFRLYWEKQKQKKKHEIQIKKSETERSHKQLG